MPIYEYRCEKCERIFEIIQKFSDEPKEKCEICNGKLEKLISQSTIKFKGAGWYVTDYGRPKRREAAKESSLTGEKINTKEKKKNTSEGKKAS